MNTSLLPMLIFALLTHGATAEVLSNSSEIEIEKSWSQEPNGWAYPMDIRVPSGVVPTGGFPVCILLHGNGGEGSGILQQFSNILPCHALVAPSGYQTSWNICSENSDAPDVEMVGDLVGILQSYSNLNPNRIRILGTSNGSALANSVMIENTNSGVDIICAIVSQLSETQYHDGGLFRPSGETNPNSPNCGYDVPSIPATGRKYLGIFNDNDPVIPYQGGPSPIGMSFINAQLATYLFAVSQGFDGDQIKGIGSPIGNPLVFEYAYLSDRVVHLRSNAGHGMNSTHMEYIRDFFQDCEEIDPCPADINGDGFIDGADLGLLGAGWNTAAGDVNGDGNTDGADLGIMLTLWGTCES